MNTDHYCQEIGNKPVILPVWYNVTKEEVSGYSLYLADKFAISANEKPINEIALKLIEVINPNIYKNISRFLYYQQLVKDAKTQKVPRSKLKKSEIRHENLDRYLLNRIEILHEFIFKPFLNASDFEETLDDFKRDLYPHREVEVWEAILAVLLIYSGENKITDYKLLKDIVTHLTFFSIGQVYDRAYLETKDLLVLMEMLGKRLKEK